MARVWKRAAVREAKEETSLEVQLIEQFYTYSDPSRDPRQHTISTVYIATAQGVPQGADDAKSSENFHRRVSFRIPLFLTTRES